MKKAILYKKLEGKFEKQKIIEKLFRK